MPHKASYDTTDVEAHVKDTTSTTSTTNTTTKRGLRGGFAISLGAIVTLCLIIWALYADYPTDLGDSHVAQYYFYLSGVLIMVFIGFGGLMTFLRRYALSAITLNFGLSAMMMLGAVFCLGWAKQGFGHFIIDIPLLIDATFCAAAGMITFGALIGFTTPTQLVYILAAEVPVYSANFYLLQHCIGAFDVGGSISIHAFGAFYGLAASYFLTRASKTSGPLHPKAGSQYMTDVTSMFGTLFLWIFWPSFNAALASTGGEVVGGPTPHPQIFVIMNTLISLLGACVATFILSAALNDAIDMVHIQNATLSGGVAIGTAAALRVAPAATFGVGLLAGTLSTLGFQFLSPWVFKCKCLGIADTCCVLSLHGMPGVLGGLVSALFTGIYYSQNEGFFMEMGHSQGVQAGLQLAGLCATVGIALVTGAGVGYLCSVFRIEALSKSKSKTVMDDGEDDLYEDAVMLRNVQKEE